MRRGFGSGVLVSCLCVAMLASTPRPLSAQSLLFTDPLAQSCSVRAARPLFNHTFDRESAGPSTLSPRTSVGKLRAARSSSGFPTMTLLDKMGRATQPDAKKRNWIRRHPVLFGALVGYVAGFVIGYAPGDDGVFDDFDASFNGHVIGGVGAGVGAVTGAIIGAR